MCRVTTHGVSRKVPLIFSPLTATAAQGKSASSAASVSASSPSRKRFRPGNGKKAATRAAVARCSATHRSDSARRVQDHYDIKEVLSSTLYGRVVRCVCKKTGRKVAVKVSSGQSPYDVRRGRVNCTLEDTEKEQQLTRLLRKRPHPNVVKVVDDSDLYNTREKSFLFMEHADGDLWELLFKPGGFPHTGHIRRTKADGKSKDLGDNVGNGLKEDVVRLLFKQVLDGVQHIHSVGWAHRDLSLENFLIFDTASDPFVENDDKSNQSFSSEFRVAVADFGMAVDCKDLLGVASSQAGSTTEATQLFSLPASQPRPGKVGSMAPEVFNFQSYNPFLCDAFACGLILFEMMFGESLFERPDVSCAGFRMLERCGVRGVVLKRFPHYAVSDEVVNLLESLLALDYKKRSTVAEAAQHRWFADAEATSKGRKRSFGDVDKMETCEQEESTTKKLRKDDVPVKLYRSPPVLLSI